MAASYLLTPPEKEPVELEVAMKQLRYDDDADDEAGIGPLLASALLTAREQAEHELGRALITQGRRLELVCWPDGRAIELDFPPVQSITALEYWDGENWLPLQAPAIKLVRVDGLTFTAALQPGQAWPALGLGVGPRVRIDFVAGYGDEPANVPNSIRQWIVAHAGHAVSSPSGKGDAPNEYLNRLLDAARTRL